jgi:hypothetical protein
MVLNTPYLPYNKNNIQAPEGNFESNKNRTSVAKAACAWNSYGTAEAVPFLRPSFLSPRVGSAGGQL